MKRKVQKGFTLIELIIAMFTSTIVIVAAGLILFYGQKSWNNTWQRVNLQRDASYVMQRMSRSIKAGTSAKVEADGKGLRVYNDYKRSWNNTWDRVSLQRDASYAMQRMSRFIKAGTSARVEGDGKGLRVYNDIEGSWRRFFVQSAANNLTLKTAIVGESISDETILDGNVEDLQFNVTGTTVRIEIKLREDNLQTHFVSTVMMRNYGQ